MGYMGLEHLNDSDMAADLASVVMDKMFKELKKGLKEKANEYNTNGAVNVALFFEAFILPVADEYKYCGEAFDVALSAKTTLESQRANMKISLDWDDEVNKKMHLDAYARMIKSLDRFLSYKL